MLLSRSQQAQVRWSINPRARARGGFWWTLLWYVVVFALSEILRPKPELENAKPAGLGEFQFPTATEGRSVPLIWGTIQINGPNVVWYGDKRQEAITEKVKTGMFSSDIIIKGFKYKLGIQFALCRGPVDSLLRVWVGDDEVYSGTTTHGNTFTISEPDLFGGDDLGNGGIIGTLKFFSGTATQVVSSYLSSFQVVGPNNKTPAYRGTCHIVPDVDPVYLGNSTSIKPWKFELKRIPNPLSLGSAGAVSTSDCNPVTVIYEVLTDTDWGLGIAASKIDTTNFAAAGTTLLTEGNGFSYLLDSPIEAEELISLVEQQIDGVVFFNQALKKYQIRLARADYNPLTVTELNETNIVKLNSFARASWEDTTNIVRCQYNDRSDNYKLTYGLAQDSANIRIQGGVNITVTRNYPGVKNGTLANTLAWRDLRTLSYPLAKANITVDRTFFDTEPGEPFTLTDTDLELVKLPMRVTRIDYGDLEDGLIHLDLVQDVFYFQVGSFGNGQSSGWSPPLDTLAPFDAAEQILFEQPRALNARDPASGVPGDNRVWISARRQGVEVTYKVNSKPAASAQSAYVVAVESVGFIKIGELASTLDTTGAVPIASMLITPSPDLRDDIIALFDSAPSVSVLGKDLLGLIVVGNEFMLVQDAAASGANANLLNVYRGVLDSVREKHASGTDVWMMVAGGCSAGSYGQTEALTFRLQPRSSTDIVTLASTTEFSVTLDKRSRRPYPPGRFSNASTHWPSTISLEQLGGGAEATGFSADWVRRDYRTGNDTDEIPPLTTDAATLFPDFPALNTSRTTLEVWDDPDGTPVLLLTFTDLNAIQQNVLRLSILLATGGALPTRMRVKLRAKHTEGPDVLLARYDLVHDFNVTSALTGFFEFGALDTNVVSAVYTATQAGTYSLTLSSAFTVGSVEYRINAGAFLPVITAGMTSGSILLVAVSDTIEVRHTSTDSGALKQLTMTAPGGGQSAFAVLYV